MPEKRSAETKMQRAIRKAREWMPEESSVAIEPMTAEDLALGTRSRQALKLTGAPVAHFRPDLGRVRYNPARMAEQEDPERIANFMVHELTHARRARQRAIERDQRGVMQRLQDWWLGPSEQPQYAYGQDPEELAAYQAMSDRSLALGFPASYTPSFGGGPKEQQDIALPPPKRTLGSVYGVR